MTMLRRTLLLAALLPVPVRAQRLVVPEGEHLRIVARQWGWTVLRDVTAPADAAETALVLIRPQRPVPPEARAGHLAATLRNLRPFRFGPLPAETEVRIGGLPATVIETTATGARSGQILRLRAESRFAPERSWLLVAAAPPAAWDALGPEMLAILQDFHSG
ncbi:hypothetical protein GCM10011504_12070 [Siccirubricoccus deserti]|nr:hypothetical protein GCM10011504_12070 [Siccirubricoccus deserti]